MAWHSVLARRILPRPTPTPAGDKPPRYISPLPTHGPLSCIGVLERVSRLVQAEAWPAGGFAIRRSAQGELRIAPTTTFAFGGTPG